MKVGENMCHINLNSHAKFHGDQTIGGAITVKIDLKNTIFGATEQRTRFSDIFALARKPIVENSKTLHFWNPWVNQIKMAISDFISA